MEIKNTHVIITGGSSGIGKATAELLISQGAKVLITGRDKKKLEKVAAEIGAIPFHFDISDLISIPKKAKEIVQLLDKKIDVIINNAGIGYFANLGNIEPQKLLEVYQTNVFGLMLFTQELLPILKTQQSGNIINIGSTASLKGFASGSVYAASKFAVRGITQSWQAELRKDNIRVMLINPSEVTTAFAVESRKEKSEANNKLSPTEIAHTILSTLTMHNKGFIPQVDIWATNPF